MIPMKLKRYIVLSVCLLVFFVESIGQSIVRGPYLQSTTTNSTTIRWRTDSATDSKVWYGNSSSNLTFSITSAANVLDHEVEISGLSNGTVYYYAVGNSSGQLTTPNSFHHFETLPTPGTNQVITAWILGDAGTGNTNQRNVRDGYYTFSGTTGPGTDMMILLGDNAYDSGTDAEFQVALFENMYEGALLNTVIWPVPGNHDLYSADSDTETGPYYDIFTLPTAGEAGGLASGKEAYYSVDHGNVHMIFLDSDDTDNVPGSAMMNWLANDLANNNLEWTVVSFHHSPYFVTSSKGVAMRENVLPVLEAAWCRSGFSRPYA